MPIQAVGPNAEQIRYWNEISGPKWVALQDFVDAQIEPLGRAAIERAALRSGERVLDVGCGCGGTSVELAARVGPGGGVTGIDISDVMLDRARSAARAQELHHLAFENADAQTHDFGGPSFDVVYSRFGVMFFAEPPAAFANLRRALRPDGRLAFVCWQSLRSNPWMLVPLMAVAEHVALPAPPPPGAPGPFAFADPEHVRGILAAAGFTDIAIEGREQTLAIGGQRDLDQAVSVLLQMGPTGAVLREAGAAVVAAAAASVRTFLEPYYTETDGLRMPGAAWLVTARNAG